MVLVPSVIFYIKICNDNDPCESKDAKIVRDETSKYISPRQNKYQRNIINI